LRRGRSGESAAGKGRTGQRLEDRLIEPEQLCAISGRDAQPAVEELELILRKEGVAGLAHIGEETGGGWRRVQSVFEVLIFEFVSGIDSLKAPDSGIDPGICRADPAEILREVVARGLGAGTAGAVAVIAGGAQFLVLRRESESLRRPDVQT